MYVDNNVVVVVVWFGDPCESPGALLLKAAPGITTLVHEVTYRPISRVVIGREVDYRSRLIYVRYCLTNTTLCL